MSNIETFRQDVRRWLDANCPPHMRTPMPQDEMPGGGRARSTNIPRRRSGSTSMAEKGWTVPTWPVKYGGGGLDKEQNQVLQEELRRINARPRCSAWASA
jgi:alkylation response protein AidB-like acyl-CoA dehydrogenase